MTKDTSKPKPRKPMAKTAKTAKPKPGATFAASHIIDERIRTLGDWRGETLAEVRRLIREADPEIVEECKWVKPSNPWGVPVWSHAGIVCTGEVYKEVVKLTFPRGAALQDPQGLFNSSLAGNTRRAIDIREGEELDAKAFIALIQVAMAANLQISAPKSPSAKMTKGKSGVVLLSGGNPQIAKADGDEPVQAYIAAMPGWKSDIGRRLDALIQRTVPNVRKAMRWNSPFYGIEGQGWFLGFHCMAKYIKVAFFRGASLQPVPPGESKQKNVRYLHLSENEPVDEHLLASWIRQAAELPGEPLF